MIHTKNHKYRHQGGSAMILVVVVTVLLAVIGVMFVMVARVGEMESSAVTDNSDLDAAVDSVVARIHTILIDDLFKGGETFGNGSPLYNHPTANPWLASLEPVQEPAGSGNYIWPDITNLNNGLDPLAWDRRPVIIRDNQPASAINPGSAADADGDGVADSIWIRMPNISTSRGRPVFAAVRIIDNCAMLNLNTAFGFYQNTSTGSRPWHSKPWFVSQAHVPNLPYGSNADQGEGLGRILGEINATPFLRAYDLNRIERLRRARDPITLTKPAFAAPAPQEYFDYVIKNIEAPDGVFTLFGIDDELEIRNRYLLTSKTIARFEKRHLDTEARTAIPPTNPYSGTLYYTFDLGRGSSVSDPYDNGAGYFKSRVPSTPFTTSDFAQWKDKINPLYFDFNPDSATLEDYVYDRRHISTFYSFDRTVQTSQYPQLVADFLQAMQAAGFPTAQAAENAARIFWPAGYVGEDQDGNPVTSVAAVTTNIAVPQLDPSGQIVRDGEGNIVYNYNNVQARQRILHLLYAFRAYYLDQGNTVREAARRAAQIVANMIDYSDDDELTASGPFADAVYGVQINAEPTYLSKAIIDEMIREVSQAITGNEITVAAYSQLDFGLEAGDVIYGYERQPFITELYTQIGPDGVVGQFAIELFNPYDTDIDISGWQIVISEKPPMTIPAGAVVKANERRVLCSHTPPAIPVTGEYTTITGMLLSGTTQSVELQRPAAGEMLIVDRIGRPQIAGIVINPSNTDPAFYSSMRDDTQWRFANADAFFTIRLPNAQDATLGRQNGELASGSQGYQLPVANDNQPIDRLADFIKISFVGNQQGGTDPRTITEQIADAADESDVRFDVASVPELLDYICFLNRPDKGSLPGRININTAALHVIAAAIPPQLVMAELEDTEHALYFAEQIIANRPYQRVSDLLAKIPAFQKYNNHSTVTVGDQNVRGDFEERDWILGRLANIFTVRSDTFTAYILVRLGQDGPQRRMIAIFDRSQCWTPDDRPRLVALHPVPDPR